MPRVPHLGKHIVRQTVKHRYHQRVISGTHAHGDLRAESEAAFLRAARVMLAEGVPYADVSIGTLAARAGRSRTAFYFSFRGKPDLLMRLTASLAAELIEQADGWWSGTGSPEDLRAAIASVVGVFREQSALLRAVVETSVLDAEVSAFWRDVIERFIDATARRLAADAPDSTERSSARGVAFVLVWMTERAAYQHIVRGGALDDAALIDALVSVWSATAYPGTAVPPPA